MSNRHVAGHRHPFMRLSRQTGWRAKLGLNLDGSRRDSFESQEKATELTEIP